MARPSGRAIREEVIDAACRMVQEVGVNSFSFGALASKVGVAAPSIHHHFRTKDDLVGAVSARYRSDFAGHVDAIVDERASGRLASYAQIFADAASKEMLCFCGSLASDWTSVGEEARAEVSLFFVDQVAWVAAQLELGNAAGEFAADDPAAVARLFVAALEGALLMARAGDDARLPQAVAATLIEMLRT